MQIHTLRTEQREDGVLEDSDSTEVDMQEDRA